MCTTATVLRIYFTKTRRYSFSARINIRGTPDPARPSLKPAAARAKSFTLNCPFPAGAGRKEILGAVTSKLLPEMKRFKPELVLISAGFDSRVGDPLGGFTLTDDDFADLTMLMLELAKEYAQSRVVSVLEGGYNLEGLGKAVAEAPHRENPGRALTCGAIC